MKKYLFLARAAMSFAACTEKIDDNNPQTGELEESYIAINLMSADLDTRAATDSYGYEEGTTAERAIKTAYFFFFDAEGNAFNVTGAPATAPGRLSCFSALIKVFTQARLLQCLTGLHRLARPILWMNSIKLWITQSVTIPMVT